MQGKKKAKTHHEHQNCAKGKEIPENEPLEEIILDRKMTYSLRNGQSSRESSQNKVIFRNKHLPTKRICYRHLETM